MLVTLLAALNSAPAAFAIVDSSGSDIDAPYSANYFADTVITDVADDISHENTSDAEDTRIDDINLGNKTNDAIYFGFDEQFDAVSIDFGSSVSGGSYILEYWDGSDWSTLVSETSENLDNDSGLGALYIEWDRPSDWDTTTVDIDEDESGSSSTSDSLYFSRLRITSDYNDVSDISQIGLTVYNLVLDVEDELGNNMNEDVEYEVLYDGSDADIYAEEVTEDGIYIALDADSGSTYTYVVSYEGFVTTETASTVDESQDTVSVEMDYAYLVILEDEDGDDVENATVTVDDNDCVYDDHGEYYCAVPLEDDEGYVEAEKNGFDDLSDYFDDVREDDTDGQEIQTFEMDEDGNSSDDKPDLVVENIDKDGDDIEFTIQNESDEDITTNSTIYTRLYIDGDREWYMTTSDTDDSDYYNGNDEERFTARDVLEDLDDGTYEIEICVDKTDVVNEESESNNCTTKNITIDNDDDDEDLPDLVVDDIYLRSDDEIVIKLQNEGDEDVDEDERVYTHMYVDGDLKWSSSTKNTSTSSYLNAGKTQTFYTGYELDDDDEYEVEVIVDYYDTVDEESESNNDRTEDFDIDDNGSDGPDLKVTDIWTDDDGDIYFEVENIGDEDVDSNVSVKTKLYVDDDLEWSKTVTRTSSNFLSEDEDSTYNVGDLDLDYGDTYEIEVCTDTSDNVDEERESNNCRTERIKVGYEDYYDDDDNDSCHAFYDINRISWATDAICELYDEDIVNGKNAHYFEPEQATTRAEFLKMLLLAGDYDPYSISSGDHYKDVNPSDWFYKYVTYATKRGFVDGYDDNTFRPNDPINRAEAVVMLMRIAYEDDYWSYDSDDIPFWDVSRTDWYAYAVVKAYEDDVIEGNWDHSFRGGDPLSRAAAAVIVVRAMNEYF